jgi:integrase
MFNRAVEDDILLSNPFEKLSTAVKVEKKWYYVTPADYQKLMEAAPNPNWRLLISLCRLTGLRSGEALRLEWEDIDWDRNCLKVMAKEDWRPKDKDPRTPPLCPELQKLLLQAYEVAKPGQKRVIGKMSATNLHRDFGVIRQQAGVNEYRGPFQTMRKNCYEDWARNHPVHVVKEWAGHSSLDITAQYYLQVSESEYKRAAERSFLGDLAQLFAQLDQNKGVDKKEENAISLLKKNLGKSRRA